MKYFLAGLLMVLTSPAFSLLFVTPAFAVSFSVVQSNSEFIEINQGGTVFRITLADLRQGSRTIKTADLLVRIQNFTQVRLGRLAIPQLDEPTRMIDPGGFEGGGYGERFFWCESDGTPTVGDQVITTHVCSQASVVTNLFWDTESQSYILTIRNALDCVGNPTFPSCQ